MREYNVEIYRGYGACMVSEQKVDVQCGDDGAAVMMINGRLTSA